MAKQTSLEKKLLDIVSNSTLPEAAKNRLAEELKTKGFGDAWYAMFEQELANAHDDLFASTNLTLDPKEHPELAAAVDNYIQTVNNASQEYASTMEWAEGEMTKATNSLLKGIAKAQVALATE